MQMYVFISWYESELNMYAAIFIRIEGHNVGVTMTAERYRRGEERGECRLQFTATATC